MKLTSRSRNLPIRRFHVLEDRIVPAIYNVTTSADSVSPGDGVLSLREAVLASNASSTVDDTIVLPAGNYVLTTVGEWEDSAAKGDLDVLGNVLIVGAGPSTTFINGNASDRIFDIKSGNVTISGMTISNGLDRSAGSTFSAFDGGGGIRSTATLTISNCVIRDNTVAASAGTSSSGPSVFGGGICQLGGSLHLSNTVITYNRAIGGSKTSSTQSVSGGGANGGGIYVDYKATMVLIADCSITENTALGGNATSANAALGGETYGGGIYCTVPVTQIERTRIEGNSSLGGLPFGSNQGDGGRARGGGIFTGALRMTDCSVVDNRAIGASALTGNLTYGGNVYGGGVFASSLVLDGCTIAGNSLAAGAGKTLAGRGEGAGVFCSTGTRILGSTISSNTASGDIGANVSGGAIFLEGSSATILQSTITNNQAPTGSGVFGDAFAVVTLGSSIIAGNGTTPDLADRGDFAWYSIGNNLIGNGKSASSLSTLDTDIVGGVTTPNVDPLLAPLANNGGSNKTHAILPGSPAIDSGRNFLGRQTDQRGSGYVRSVGNSDIGAFEYQATGVPRASVSIPAVSSPGATSCEVTVTYFDDTGIDVATIGAGDILIHGPGGFATAAKLTKVDSPVNGSPREAYYRFTPPGGSWDATDIGQYSVSIANGSVADISGSFVPGGVNTEFGIDLPGAIVVTTLANSGPGSLRDAILTAELTSSADTISFLPALFTSPVTIGLSSPIPLLSQVTLTGPGPEWLTLDGQNSTRVFVTDTGAVSPTNITISGLTMTRGWAAGFGGAVFNGQAVVTVSDCVLTSNTSAGGGAIANTGANLLTIVGSQLTANSTSWQGGAVMSFADLTIADTEMSLNASFDSGGAISNIRLTTVTSSTIAGNTSSANGGGIYSAHDLSLQNVTLTGNRATIGGGVHTGSAGKIGVVVHNCTIVDNTATTRGGGINGDGVGIVTITSSVINKNSCVLRPDMSFQGRSVALTYSQVGVLSFTQSAASANNRPFGEDPKLLPLADNGGRTKTFALLPDSPLHDRGLNVSGLQYDQRGSGFPRQVGLGTDIGALESAYTPPMATAVVSGVTAGGAVSHAVSVKFVDDIAVDISTIGDGDLKITGPSGFFTTAHLLDIDVVANSPDLNATYSFVPPGGTWDQEDYGTYSVFIAANQVSDESGTFASEVKLASFDVKIASRIVVFSTADSGPGTLRAAAALAEQRSGVSDTIEFDNSAFATPKTILLTSGPITFTESVTIRGPSANLVNIDAGGKNRAFTFQHPTFADITAVIERVTISRGVANGSGTYGKQGGGILAVNANLTLRESVITGCSAGTNGGGVNIAGSLYLHKTTLLHNSASATGGGIYGRQYDNKTLVVRQSALMGNSASIGGGLLSISNNPVVVDSSEVSYNTAWTQGGGLSCGVATVLNSTLFGNLAANGKGGAISVESSIVTTLQNCTIAGNTATTSGGGIDVTLAVPDKPVSIKSSIVNANVAATGRDVSALRADVTYSVVGSAAGFSLTATSGQNLPFGTSPVLAPLGFYGGATRTMALLPGSPCINTGSNPSAFVFDQRGTGFPRESGKADMGAFEYAAAGPVGVAAASDVTTAGGTVHTFSVTYFDSIAVNVSTLGTGDVRVTGPGGFDVAAQFIGVDVPVDGTPRTATYRIIAPGGAWDGADNGVYNVVLQAGEVAGASGMTSLASTIGTFKVGLPNTLFVTNDADSGPGSLRAAIVAANANAGLMDAIVFDSAFFQTPRTIALTSGELVISDGVQIEGPGAAAVTLTANGASRLFAVNGPSTIEVTIRGMQLSGGAADTGGAVLALSGQLRIENCVVAGNKASANGGGIASLSGSVLVIESSSLHANTAAKDGGCVYVAGETAIVTIRNSNLTQNQATGGGGGSLYLDGCEAVLVERTLVSASSAGGRGGGIGGFTSPGAWTIRDCAIVGNTVDGFGGGLGILDGGAQISIVNSTISGNRAVDVTQPGIGGRAGGVFFETSGLPTQAFSIVNCTVTDNSASVSWGGVRVNNVGNSVAVSGSIISGNAAQDPVGIDIKANGVMLTRSAIGSGAGFSQSPGSGSNLAFGTNLSLAPLANNGGPTPTHALPANSPCIDTGDNLLLLSFDQRGTPFSRSTGLRPDIGAFEYQGATAGPITAAVTVNDGTQQRSMVRSITVVFSSAVTFPQGMNSAIRLVRTGPGNPVGPVKFTFTQTSTQIVIQPSDAIFATTGSLIDGRYTLTIDAQFLGTGTSGFDGNADGVSGDNLVYGFHRLMGDADGNRSVDAADFLAFRLVYLSNNQTFDFDGDGQVGTSDFLMFRLNFLSSV
ncbi:MAG: hypothetical protein K1X57_15370 [Gemmataceae bacterium]|nr:hypothetical protein [Gemmataceae bacterium]